MKLEMHFRVYSRLPLDPILIISYHLRLCLLNGHLFPFRLSGCTFVWISPPHACYVKSIHFNLLDWPPNIWLRELFIWDTRSALNCTKIIKLTGDTYFISDWIFMLAVIVLWRVRGLTYKDTAVHICSVDFKNSYCRLANTQKDIQSLESKDIPRYVFGYVISCSLRESVCNAEPSRTVD